jgi:CheY-like chemotaxis protein
MPVYRVLVVDDHRDARRMLRAGLDTLGQDIKVLDVPSGEEAILVLSRQPVDLLVADVLLPGISGLELVERAQVRNPNMKVILITGLTDPKVRRDIERAHSDAYFFKPIEMLDFLSAVERCLGMRQLPAAPEPDIFDQVIADDQATMTSEKGQVPPPVVPPPAEAPLAMDGLSPRLIGLRQNLNAICAVLINDNGEIMAQAGDLPPDVRDPALVSLLMNALGATSKVSHLLGSYLPDNWISFAGKSYDLFLTPIGKSIGLLVVTSAAGWEGERLGKFLRAMRSTESDLSATLAEWGVFLSIQEEREEDTGAIAEQEVADEAPLDLEAIFGKAQKKQVKVEDLDAFWEAATQDSQEEVTRADVISYSQARQLGLAPDEN